MSSLELAHRALAPTNVIVKDDTGRPSVLVRIPKFRICDVLEGGSEAVHPAFIVNGEEIPEIWVSKYQNVVRDGLAYSLPDENPEADISFEQARVACEAKGDGWHLLTAAEWAAIALWCRRNGTMPYGNNDFGKDYREAVRQATPASWESLEGQSRVEPWQGNVAAVRTGTGPVSWTHNGEPSGIYDLAGNLAEWLGGCRLNDGELNIIADNDAAAHIDQGSDSRHWRAIAQSGELLEPGADGSLKLDFRDGSVVLSDRILVPSDQTVGGPFETARVDEGARVPEIVTALALFPSDDGDYSQNYAYVKTLGERICMRGSHWNRQSRVGIFSLYFAPTRNMSAFMMGFRSAYIPQTTDK